ncbi:hypothetical protein AQI88_30235 [Streptomyces cellostaticus]|uniref:Uncharacterized protein n=1 Tax=Streptomyces cellostaticus TaxID=67285 RepID=A0A101NGP6_9ACTN|nr:hypothetical protein [Streptomyces cellostaticus]KUM92835.1 hypothetical protein AQI88_30235 [Streptomyces cellostaticus]GHI06739.1 hypothetical protein Scel_50600 [Streptomyces cellostaticus]
MHELIVAPFHDEYLLRDTVLVRAPSPYGMARAFWETNKHCDYVDRAGNTRAIHLTDGRGPVTRAVRRRILLQQLTEGHRRRQVARRLS